MRGECPKIQAREYAHLLFITSSTDDQTSFLYSTNREYRDAIADAVVKQLARKTSECSALVSQLMATRSATVYPPVEAVAC